MSSLVMVVAGLCCGQFYLAAGIRQDPACGRFWHLGDCDRVTGQPEITLVQKSGCGKCHQIGNAKRACGKLRINEYSTCRRKKKAGILDSGLLFHEMVAGVRFELTTFGL